MSLRPSFLILGLLLVQMGVLMLIPALVDFLIHDQDWQCLGLCSLFSCSFGGMLAITNWNNHGLNLRQSFLTTSLAWLILPIFAALPLYFSDTNIAHSFSDAYFEAVSGLTTTGATVIKHLDNASKGILLWRSLLQFYGGIGIIVMAISVLPMLNVGGMRLFYVEFSKTDKIFPKVAQFGIYLLGTYLTLTCVCTLFYYGYGMSFFDAINHAMATTSTGGFSTHDLSLGYFHNPKIEFIATVFMIIVSMPFVIYYHIIHNNLRTASQGHQIQFYLKTIGCATLLQIILMMQHSTPTIIDAFHSLFTVVTVISGTGFITPESKDMMELYSPLFFFLMFVGGCAGSTACGIKPFRIQIMLENLKTEILRLFQPNRLIVPMFGGRPITQELSLSVSSFFFCYILVFLTFTLIVMGFHYDFTTSLTLVSTTLSNVGPALSSYIPPDSDFYTLEPSLKYVLSLSMIMGRLELLTILTLFQKDFWV